VHPPLDARAEILDRIASAQLLAGDGTGPVAAPVVVRDYRRADDPWETGADRGRVADLFEERLVDYKARVHRCAEADLAWVVADVLADARTLVVAHDLPSGWTDTWLDSADGARLEVDQPAHPLTARALDAADAVLTASAVGIALTGTIVLDAGPGQGRRAISLVPDWHVCVVREDTVTHGVPAAVGRLDFTRPLTWISGPSATSDIEMNRVEGVHGPRTLDVILVH
jgi:L-lactate dehydrogenase complex protein LldG